MPAPSYVHIQNMENVRDANNHDVGKLSSNRFLSYNGQATYVYDNKYILSGNFSRMASDNYAPEDRWGNFYGASLGWVASRRSMVEKTRISAC